MNIFTELSNIIEGRTDDELIQISVANIKRMISSADAMNGKADAIRQHYLNILGVPLDKRDKAIIEIEAILTQLIED